MKICKKNRVSRLVAVFILAGMVTMAGNASAQTTVFYSNFDNDALAVATTTLNDWTVTVGNVDVIGPGFADLYPGNGHYLDMDGLFSNGTIQSAPLTLAAGTYRLSFEMGNNSLGENGLDNGMTVSLGAEFHQSFLAPLHTNWDPTNQLVPTSVEFTVTSDTTASLIFQETGTVSAGGTVLDDVLLEFLAPLVVDVTLDIRPGNCENKINSRSAGKTNVAILGSADFDVSTIDASTVRLVTKEGFKFKLEDEGSLTDCNAEQDGFTDLKFKISTQALLDGIKDAVGTLSDGDIITVVLTGNLLDGTQINGSDDVLILKRGKGRGR